MIEPDSDRWLNMKDLPNEEWKDVKGFEGLYQVSNYGRVKRLPEVRFLNHISGIKVDYITKGKILKSCSNGKGYLQVCLTKNNKKHTKKIHRLVAETFLLNSKNLPQVNHKNENKHDNNINNLEWCDCDYNINYSLAKPIMQYKNNKLIREWESINKIRKELGYSTSFISRCCKHKCESAYGYKWIYK